MWGTLPSLILLGHCRGVAVALYAVELPEEGLGELSLLQVEWSRRAGHGSSEPPAAPQSEPERHGNRFARSARYSYRLASICHGRGSLQGALSSDFVEKVQREVRHDRLGGSNPLPLICVSLLAVLSACLIWTFWGVPRALLAERRGGPITEVDSSSDWASKAAVVVCYGLLYIACSVALIKYNKYLVSEERFPFAMNLTLGHQICGSVFLFVLYALCPSLFPSFAHPSKRAKCFSLRFIGGAAIPISICFIMQLVLSNFAYLYASVAFLQMMKEGNMALVYSLTLLSGLEVFRLSHAHLLCCLALSTIMTVEGELSFSPMGFMMQGSSQFAEATKIVVQSMLLSAAGSVKLDALSYNCLIQPISGACLLICLIATMTSFPGVPVATWADYAIWWPHLLGNACVALSLNILIALFVGKTSAVGFIICGIVRDICLVAVDVSVSGTALSRMQVIAFMMQIVFVATYSFLKLFEQRLEVTSSKSKTVT